MSSVIEKNIKKVLFLPIEIVERELDAKLLLTSEAVSRGYFVVLGNYWKVLALAKKWGGGVFLYKDMIDQRVEKFWEPLSASGVKICILDEEGLIFPNLDYYIRTRIGAGLSLPYLEKIFTWGDKQRERIGQLDGCGDGALVATGNPRIDLLRYPYSSIYEGEQDGGFVLINTNFGPGNYSPYFGMSYFEHMSKLGRIVGSVESDYYRERVSYYANLFVQYKDMVSKLAERIYPVPIVVRPHPVEDHEAWRNYFREFKNVSVVYSGGVLGWISASVCVIHTGCTTGLEAFVMGKPVLRYNPALRSDMESPLPNSIGEGFVEVEALVSRVESILEGKNGGRSSASQLEHLKSWIENVDGDFSYVKIMDEIDRIDIKASNLSFRRGAAGVVRDFLVYIKRFIYSYIGDRSDAFVVSRVPILRRISESSQRYSGLTLSRVRGRWNRIRAVRFGGVASDVTPTRLGPDVFMITDGLTSSVEAKIS